MTRLSEWLELMLAEVARKREAEEREREERLRRVTERDGERTGHEADGPAPSRR